MAGLLIIEPDFILAREYQKAFAKEGFNVTLCSGAQDAISAIDEKLPAVIILELQLVGHSGIEFLHELRSYEDWSDIKIFVYSRIPERALGVDNGIWKKYGVIEYHYKTTTPLKKLVGRVKDAQSSNDSS